MKKKRNSKSWERGSPQELEEKGAGLLERAWRCALDRRREQQQQKKKETKKKKKKEKEKSSPGSRSGNRGAGRRDRGRLGSFRGAS
eukprot:CAMPEP_0171578218 /NCGR_PEP_ID=MMETSP0961-20121227/7715_1 /TAXON_ID=87120 /ORGANISM="Aurantiochytrium limacinum, Strain ATCCMYA-1381" /LENGTH=85 /DNA_ID=CAMNT_0012134469 /DNA_START=96 /DNA_END=353 /DNA_ORIENTATION=+